MSYKADQKIVIWLINFSTVWMYGVLVNTFENKDKVASYTAKDDERFDWLFNMFLN